MSIVSEEIDDEKVGFGFAIFCLKKLSAEELLDYTSDYQILLRDVFRKKAEEELSNTNLDDEMTNYHSATNDEIEKVVLRTMTNLDDYIELVKLNWRLIVEELMK